MLHLVSNRLPVSVSRADGRLTFEPSVGGLATGLKAYHEFGDCLWHGWPGVTMEELSEEERRQVAEELERRQCRPVFLGRTDVEEFYDGFCNRTIWPLFHYFSTLAEFNAALWDAYVRANRRYCEELAAVVKHGDSVWIHDYQLLLLPQMLRESNVECRIGLFLHIPFPSFEILRLLPWREQVLRGMLGADLVGFHTYEYVRHFFSASLRVLDIEHTMGRLWVEGRTVRAEVFPMGIDYELYRTSTALPAVQANLAEVKEQTHGRRIVLSVDRLDYTKGIVERLNAYECFLNRYPEYHGNVVLLLVEVPSRTGVPSYTKLKEEVDRLIGAINGKHGSIGWAPIQYVNRPQPFEMLAALYAAADVALVTPLRDGMNLVAKEYVATNAAGHGVLVLSETAGAAREMGEALKVNPYDIDGVAEAIDRALQMPAQEQERAIRMMCWRLQRYTAQKWARDFVEQLAAAGEAQAPAQRYLFHTAVLEEVVSSYRSASHRLLLLDYDGTLAPFASAPARATPPRPLLDKLAALGAHAGTTLYVVSSRDRNSLDAFFGGLGALGLIAEHGAWVKDPGAQWQAIGPEDTSWKERLRPLLQLYVDRTPGALLEEKELALAWHYRMAEDELATLRRLELKGDLGAYTNKLNLTVIEGRDVLEVKSAAITKRAVAQNLVARGSFDYILAAGSDVTDEDLFDGLPPTAVTIHVGPGATRARYYAHTVAQMHALLTRLAQGAG